MMRKKKYWLIFCLLSPLSLRVLAQEELYIQNDELVNSIAEKAAKSRSNKNQVKKDIYADVIKTAFREYWTSKECLSPIVADSMANIHEAITQLKEQKSELTKTIKTLLPLVNENKNLANMKEQIAKIQQESEVLRHEADSIDTLIAQTTEEMKKLEPQLKKLEKVEERMKVKREEIEEVVKELNAVKEECAKTSLLDSLLRKKATALLQSFYEKRRLMQNISEATEKKSSERAEYINLYISLSDALQQGITQMGASFSAKQNQEIIDSISELMSQMGESSDLQKKECNEVVRALREQEKSYTAFINFLDSIVSTNGVISDEEMRADVKDDIEKELKENSSLKFSKYYTKFQEVLNQLVSDMSENSPTLSLNSTKEPEGLRRYINDLKKKL